MEFNNTDKEKETAAGEPPLEKVVVLDVDGVVIAGQFFIEISRRIGLFCYLNAFRNALSFNAGIISLNQLLSKSYKHLQGIRIETLSEAFCTIPRAKNIKEAICRLKEQGYFVLLLSSGIPGYLVKQLAIEIGADQGEGIKVHDTNGVLNGKISNVLTQDGGKLRFMKEWSINHKIPLSSVTVVGDDNNNLGIMEHAGLSIGFHATSKVRRHADFLVESEDFLQVASLITNLKSRPEKTKLKKLKLELRRRLVHTSAFALPFVFQHYPIMTILFLSTVLFFFCLSEYFRLNGLVFPAFGNITNLTIRDTEKRSFAVAPPALAMGVLVCLFFQDPIPFISIGIIAFGDSGAGLVGQFFGRYKLPYNKHKTVEGTFTSFVICFLLSFYFLSFPQALAVASFSSFIESLSLGEWDNFLMPVSSALFCQWLLFY